MTKPNKALKPGWRRVKFGDVVHLSKERSQNPVADGFDRYVGLEHLEPGDLRICSWGNVADGVTFTSIFQPGQVLFGKRRAYQRKVAVADFAGVCSGDIYVLESNDPEVLLPGLLPFICQTEAFFDHAVGTSAGSLSPRTNWTSLAEFEFALPPLDEQHRLTQLLQEAEHTRACDKDAAEYCEKIRKSLLIGTFDALSQPEATVNPFFGSKVGCRWIRTAQAGSVLMGRQLSPKYKVGPKPKKYLRVANVFDGFIDAKDVNEMDFSETEFGTFQLKFGDVLLNEGQSRELVGRSAIFRDEVRDCCFQNTLIRFRPSAGLLPEFAHHFFQYCQYTSRFVQISKQTTSIAHLGVQRFAKMRVPLISLDHQRAFVSAMADIAAAKSGLSSMLGNTESIKKSILSSWGNS